MKANSKLNEKLQEESNVLAQKLNAADQVIFESTNTNRILREKVDAETNRFASIESSEAEEKKIESTDTNRILHEELDAETNRFASIESNFKSRIQNLDQQLSKANNIKTEMTNANRKLQEDFNNAKIQQLVVSI